MVCGGDRAIDSIVCVLIRFRFWEECVLFGVRKCFLAKNSAKVSESECKCDIHVCVRYPLHNTVVLCVFLDVCLTVFSF